MCFELELTPPALPNTPLLSDILVISPSHELLYPAETHYVTAWTYWFYSLSTCDGRCSWQTSLVTPESRSCPNQPWPNQNNASGSLALIPEICDQFQCEHCNRLNDCSLKIKLKTLADYTEAKKDICFFFFLLSKFMWQWLSAVLWKGVRSRALGNSDFTTW